MHLRNKSRQDKEQEEHILFTQGTRMLLQRKKSHLLREKIMTNMGARIVGLKEQITYTLGTKL
jgi:hypothetical protein